MFHDCLQYAQRISTKLCDFCGINKKYIDKPPFQTVYLQYEPQHFLLIIARKLV
jgi:hypothetical protein